MITRYFEYAFIILLVLTVVGGCGSAGDTPVPGADVPGMTIHLTGNTCPGIEIKLSDQLTWVNEDNQEHPVRVVSDDDSSIIDLGALQPGDVGSLSFPQAGSYTYTCTVDQAVSGTITVLP